MNNENINSLPLVPAHRTPNQHVPVWLEQHLPFLSSLRDRRVLRKRVRLTGLEMCNGVRTLAVDVERLVEHLVLSLCYLQEKNDSLKKKKKKKKEKKKKRK